MIITNDNIEVTVEMIKSKMIKLLRLGIPLDPKDKKKGLLWKEMADCNESDFNKIEEYFLFKAK